MAETLLKIENLTKEYEGQKILDGINLEVKQGDVLVPAAVVRVRCFGVLMHWNLFRAVR